MHRVLQETDIFKVILRSLENDGDGYYYINLLNFALTCKTLSRIALDILWSSESLSVYEVLYPLRVAGVVGSESGTFEVLRTINKADWDRYEPYARRIKRVDWDLSDSKEDVLPLLNCTSPYSSLLPRLEHLTYAARSLQAHSVLQANYFFAPSLRSFELSKIFIPFSLKPTDTKALSISACILGLTYKCPKLEQLNIQIEAQYDATPASPDHAPFKRLSQDIGKALSTAFQGLHMLKDVFIFAYDVFITLDIVTHLASLPHLENLTLRLSFPRSFSATPLQIRAPFAKLKKLDFEVDKIILQDQLQIVRLTRDSPPPKLNLFWKTEGSASVQAVLTAFASPSTSASTLPTCLNLYSSPHDREDRLATNLPKLTINHLNVLSMDHFRNLAQLRITHPFQYNLRDSDLSLLAQWLPGLTELGLGFTVAELEGDWPVPKATIRGLVNLLKGCSRLRELMLSVDFETPVNWKKLGLDDRGFGLREYNIAHSRIQNHFSAASILAKLFPYLTSIQEAEDGSGNRRVGAISSFLRRTAGVRNAATRKTAIQDSVLEGYWDGDVEDELSDFAPW